MPFAGKVKGAFDGAQNKRHLKERKQKQIPHHRSRKTCDRVRDDRPVQFERLKRN